MRLSERREGKFRWIFFLNNGEIWSIKNENLRGSRVYEGMKTWGNGDLLEVETCKVKGGLLKLIFYKNGKVEVCEIIHVDGKEKRDSAYRGRGDEMEEESKEEEEEEKGINGRGRHSMVLRVDGRREKDKPLVWLPAVILSVNDDVLLDVVL